MTKNSNQRGPALKLLHILDPKLVWKSFLEHNAGHTISSMPLLVFFYQTDCLIMYEKNRLQNCLLQNDSAKQ